MIETLNIWHFRKWWNKSETAGRVQGHWSEVSSESLYAAPPRLLWSVNLLRPADRSTVSISFLKGQSETYTHSPWVFYYVWGRMHLGVCVSECVHTCEMFSAPVQSFFLWSNSVHTSSHRKNRVLMPLTLIVFDNTSCNWGKRTKSVWRTRTTGSTKCSFFPPSHTKPTAKSFSWIKFFNL